ncbi:MULTISPECIES: TetR family transcriptional regulator [Streptomyces]|uniref:TetR family transcriptional regulator n=1 Tax=Streptomyces chilikensis TaxID=1194079 RepID=A0ABV3EY43_9ACTN|nr:MULTISPECIES: TetR family transcriptional regulator [Streptomyces]MDH6226947.1 AcrR family transcriptional regulator [Streptomyces sp. MJP52]
MTENSPPADSGTLRPRRSEATRAAILRAALARFAADGYERATIRAIARDAGIDPSMVMRYYGSKEGLFRAASEIDLRMPDFSGVRPAEAGEALVRHFLQRWEEDDSLAAMLRVGLASGLDEGRQQALLEGQVGPAVARFCAAAADVPRRTALVASQMIGMAVLRYLVEVPAVTSMTHDEVVAWLAPTVQRYLTAENP